MTDKNSDQTRHCVTCGGDLLRAGALSVVGNGEKDDLGCLQCGNQYYYKGVTGAGRHLWTDARGNKLHKTITKTLRKSTWGISPAPSTSTPLKRHTRPTTVPVTTQTRIMEVAR